MLGLLLGIFNRTDIQERLLRQIVDLTVQDGVEALDGLFDRNHDSFDTCELFGDGKRLGKEALYPAGTVHDQLVLVREFIHTQNGDDVLQFIVMLQQLLYSLRTVIVLLADNQRVEDTRRTAQRVYRRIDTQLGNLTAQLGRCI